MLPFIQIYFVITLAALAAATYTDLKERLVSNKLTYGLAALGMLLKAAESYAAADFGILLAAVIGGAVGFAASYALYMLGVWAGGDVKLVTAVAFMNPINYAALSWLNPLQGALPGMFGATALPVFSISLIIASALMVFPLGIAMSAAAALRHRGILEKTWAALRARALSILGAAALVAGSKILMEHALPIAGIASGAEAESMAGFISLFVLIAAAFAPKKIGKYASAAFGIAGLALAPAEFLAGGIGVALPLFAVYAVWKLYSDSREAAFRETIPMQNVREGMIPDKYIVERGGRIELVEAPSIKTVIKQLISNRMENALGEFRIEGRVIAGPREAGGISKEAAEELIEKSGRGLAPKSISVRKTMAFVPAILAAYIALQAFGDVLLNIIFGMG